LGEQGADRRLDSYGRWVGGWVDVLTGDYQAGLARCEAALELAPDPLCRAVASQWLGFAHLEADSPDAAVPLLAEALDLYASFQFTTLHAWTGAWLGEALLALGKVDHASAQATEAVDRGRRAQFPLAVGCGQRVLGLIARFTSAFADADRHLDEAFQVFHNIGARYDMARTLIEQARLAHLQGAPERARALLTRARETFVTLDVPNWVDRTDVLAAELHPG
jgi:tetratricopeptide (TPR) repeat protein